MTKLILASSSPRRSEILNKIGVDFTIEIPEVEEISEGPDPLTVAMHNSKIKCDAIAANYPDDFVLAADTIVTLNGEIFNKPKDINDARNMLLKLSGQTHKVITAVCLKSINRKFFSHESIMSEVTFRNFDRKTVDEYFSIVNPLDKSGSYAIQQAKDMIATNFTGEISNIMGLPQEYTKNLLKQAHII